MLSLLKSLVLMRKAHGWTQAQLAERAMLSRTAIQGAESEVTDPRLSMLYAIARAMDVEIIAVPRSLYQEVEWFIRAGGKCLGHEPGISAPLSAVDELLRRTCQRK
jgi:transcriptional regulator with XRE-family HTH domain